MQGPDLGSIMTIGVVTPGTSLGWVSPWEDISQKSVMMASLRSLLTKLFILFMVTFILLYQKNRLIGWLGLLRSQKRISSKLVQLFYPHITRNH